MAKEKKEKFIEKVETDKKSVYVNRNILEAQKEYEYHINELGKCDAVKINTFGDDKELINKAARGTDSIVQVGKSIGISYMNLTVNQIGDATGTKSGSVIRTTATVASLAVNSAMRFHTKSINDRKMVDFERHRQELINSGMNISPNASLQEINKAFNDKYKELGYKTIQGEGYAGAINADSMRRRVNHDLNHPSGQMNPITEKEYSDLLGKQAQINRDMAQNPNTKGSTFKRPRTSSLKKSIRLITSSATRYLKQDDSFKGLIMIQTIAKRTTQTAKQSLKAIRKVASLARTVGHKIAIQMASIRLSNVQNRLKSYAPPKPNGTISKKQAKLLRSEKRLTDFKNGNGLISRTSKKIHNFIHKDRRPQFVKNIQAKFNNLKTKTFKFRHPIKAGRRTIHTKLMARNGLYSKAFKFFDVLKQKLEALKRKVYAILFGAGCFALIFLIIFNTIIAIIGSFDLSGMSNTEHLELYLMGLYENDFEYISSLNSGATVTFVDVKDEDLYAEQKGDTDADNFQESTNFAEILSMLYYMNDYDFDDKDLPDLYDQAEYLFYASHEIILYTYGSTVSSIQYKTYYFNSIYDCEYSESNVAVSVQAFSSGTCTYTNPTTINMGTASSIQLQVWNYLINAGFSKEGAAAIMGNMQQESHFDLDAEEESDGSGGDGSGGYGLCQWTNTEDQYGNVSWRRKYLFDYAEATGREASDIEAQLDYLLIECGIKENTTDVNIATNQFMSSKWTSDTYKGFSAEYMTDYEYDSDEEKKEAVERLTVMFAKCWERPQEVEDVRKTYAWEIYQRFANRSEIVSYHQTTGTYTYVDPYGHTIPSSGCGITSLADIAATFGITYGNDNHLVNPYDVYVESGYSVVTNWDAISGLHHFKVYNASSEQVCSYLDQGSLVIARFEDASRSSYPKFTDGTAITYDKHFVVLYGYYEENGKIYFYVANPTYGTTDSILNLEDNSTWYKYVRVYSYY